MALLWGSHMGKAYTQEAPWRYPILGCDVGPALFVCLMFFSWMDVGYRALYSIRFCLVFFHAPPPLPDLVPMLCLVLPFLTLGQPLLPPLLPCAHRTWDPQLTLVIDITIVMQVLSPTYKQRNEDFRKLFKQLPDTERLIVGELGALGSQGQQLGCLCLKVPHMRAEGGYLSGHRGRGCPGR